MAFIDVDMSESLAGKVINRAVEASLSKKPETFQSAGKQGKAKVWCVRWSFVVSDIEGQEEFAGTELERITTLAGKGCDFTERTLVGLDYPYEVAGEDDTRKIRFDDELWEGRRGMLHCEAEEWEGMPRTSIKKVTPLPKVVAEAA